MGQKFPRQALYDLLWSEPKAVLSKRLGISDVGLGKVCKKANIPVPPRGYWALHSAGKPVPKIPLPARGLGQSDLVTIGTVAWRYDEPIGELPSPPVFAEPVEEVIRRAERLIGKVAVPKSLESAHHLVTKLLNQDEERRKKTIESPYYWDNPHFETPAARRRLRLVNAILVALTRAGLKPTCDGKDGDRLRVLVGEEWVDFVVEPVKASRRQGFLFDENNGAAKQPLRIKVDSVVACPPGISKEWADVDDKPLEQIIPEVVVSLVVFGELGYRANEQHRYDWLARRKAEQEEAARKAAELAERTAREARLRLEKVRRDYLFGQALSWQMATQLREFVAAVQQHPEAQEQIGKRPANPSGP